MTPFNASCCQSAKFTSLSSNRPNGKQALLRAMKRARTLPGIAAPAGAYEREVSDADMKNPGSARAFRRKL